MARTIVTAMLVLMAVLAGTLIGGCSGNAANNSTTVTPVATLVPDGPIQIPGLGDGYAIHGRVYLDGDIVAGAQVEAAPVDGTYRTSGATDKNGVYELVLPAGAECNITAKYNGLRHTVWPVRVTESGASYNVYMTSTPKSVITGKGTAYGGPMGYDPSKTNFSGLKIMAVPANTNATVTAIAGSDGSYYMEVVPGVQYSMDLYTMPAVRFECRNTNRSGMAKGVFSGSYINALNVTPGPDETALIDYSLYLP